MKTPNPKSPKTVRHYNATSGKSRKEGRCHGKGAYSVKCLRNLNKNWGLEKLPEQRPGWTRLSQSTGPPSRVPLGHRATQSLHSRGSDLGFPDPRARASSRSSEPAVHKRWTSPHTTTSTAYHSESNTGPPPRPNTRKERH